MSILIRQARILSPGSSFNNRVADILIEGGKIAAVKKSIASKSGYRIVEGSDLHVSAGWIDMQVISGDPGFEYREDLDSLLRTAAAGGFTTVCVHSANKPAFDSKSQIEYLLNRATGHLVRLIPFGCVTTGGSGKDIAEMYDMKMSGAGAFSDYKNSIGDAGTILRALQYSANIGALIIAHCNDAGISRGGQMNEGETAAALGLRGIPALAEELMLERNLSVLEYGGGRLHVPTISTRRSAELIRKAKSAGLSVTCGVSVANLLLDESALQDFNTNFKTDPPLRTRKDVQSLRNAVENGTIDVIVSDHAPYDEENKELEFDLAEPGMISLQTAFSCALEALKEKNIGQLINCLTVNPRRILGKEAVVLNEGEEADITVFSVGQSSVLTESANMSRSKNSPFFGREMPGKVIGVVRGGKSFFN